MPSANILFIHPTVEDIKGIEKFPLTPPFGMLYIAGHIVRSGDAGKIGLVDLQFYDEKVDGSLTDYVKKSVDFCPDIIGISYMIASSWRPIKRILPILRVIYPNARIILGGNTATSSYKKLFDLLDIDYLVRGEGEIAFLKIIKCLSEGLIDEICHIQGVYNREKATKGGDVELGETLVADEMPHPYWGMLDLLSYTSAGISNGFVSDTSVVWGYLSTSRGCYNRCTYCAKDCGAGHNIRYYTDQYVLNEIQYQNKHFGVTGFIILEEMVNANRVRIKQLLQKIKDLKIEHLKLALPGVLYINTLTNEILDAFIDLGLQSLVLPVESGSKYVLQNIMKKNVNLDRAKQMAEYAKSKGLDVQAFFIIGLPGEKPEHLEETINFAKNLQADWTTFFIYNPLPGSELYEDLVQRGTIVDGPETWENIYFRNRWFTLDGVSPEDMMDIYNKINIEINFINKIVLGGKTLEKAFHWYKHIDNKTAGHVFAMLGMYVYFEKRGDMANAKPILERINHCLETSEYSKYLFNKFGYLIPAEYSNLFTVSLPQTLKEIND